MTYVFEVTHTDVAMMEGFLRQDDIEILLQTGEVERKRKRTVVVEDTIKVRLK